MEAVKNIIQQVSTFVGRKVTGPKVRYAVVAAGWISQGAFMPGVGQTSNSVMTALVTDDPQKAEELGKKYNLKSYKYAEFGRLLDEDVCDAIYIATPNWMHREFAVPALEKGYHVLLEKPMEVTEEACLPIIEASKKSGAKLMIAYRLHCEPGTLNVYERIRNNDFGIPRLFTSAFTQPLKGENHRAKYGWEAGPILDMGPYPINAVRNVFGQEPIEVTAVGFKTPGREDLKMEHDTVTVTLRFPEDKVGVFTVSYADSSYEYYSVVGSKGSIEVSPCFMFGPGVKIAYKAKIGDKEESNSFPEVDQFAGETDYFSYCIINNIEPEPNGEEGLCDVRVAIAIKKSLDTGKAVKLEPYQRSKKPTADQARVLSLGSQPSSFIGRDSQPPAKS